MNEHLSVERRGWCGASVCSRHVAFPVAFCSPSPYRSMGQKLTHVLAPGLVIDTKALRQEYNAYVAWQGGSGTTLKKSAAKRFVRDFCSIYKVSEEHVASILLQIDLDETESYGFDAFCSMFLVARAETRLELEVEISHSL